MWHVGQEQPDTVARAVAERGEAARDAVGAALRLGIAVVTAEKLDQRRLRVRGGRLFEQIDHRKRRKFGFPRRGMAVGAAPDGFGIDH